MPTRNCSECGKPAEAPLSIYRSQIPDELREEAEAHGQSMELEFVLCLDCVERMREEKDALVEVAADVRSGLICSLCYRELDPPGGTTIGSFEDKRLFRVCQTCKEKIERIRKKRT